MRTSIHLHQVLQLRECQIERFGLSQPLQTHILGGHGQHHTIRINERNEALIIDRHELTQQEVVQPAHSIDRLIHQNDLVEEFGVHHRPFTVE